MNCTAALHQVASAPNRAPRRSVACRSSTEAANVKRIDPTKKITASAPGTDELHDAREGPDEEAGGAEREPGGDRTIPAGERAGAACSQDRVSDHRATVRPTHAAGHPPERMRSSGWRD